MKQVRRLLALLLCAAMMLTLLPAASAVRGSSDYTISNDYISYTLNAKTGGFTVETKEGHPQKKYDDFMPLLYQSDGASTCTSYVTVRIDGRDYVFGQDYGWLGVNTAPLTVPRIENNGQTMITEWSVDGYTIIQKVGITQDENNDRTGNVGFSFEVVNHNAKAGTVGIRVLMDAALSNDADAPYLLADDSAVPYLTETEFKDGDPDAPVPQQIRGVNSLAGATSMCYAMLKGWDEGAAPDRVVLGHWANLANTRYEYTPNPSCDFSNYSNQYRTPDSAMAFYWSEADLAPQESRKAQFLYGVGNFDSQLADATVGLGLTTSAIQVDDQKTGYRETGGAHFTLTATVDNSVDLAQDLYGVTVTPTLDKGLSLVGETMGGVRSLDHMAKGDSRQLTWSVKVDDPATEISALQCRVAVTAASVKDAAETARDVNVEAGRYVILPAANGSLPKVSFTNLLPETVFYGQGDNKSFTLIGNMSAFSSLAGKSGWDLYLVKKGGGDQDQVRIDKKNIAFVGDKHDTLSFSTTEELPLGTYEAVFRFTETALVAAFGQELSTGRTVTASADQRYRSRSYGIIALVRYDGTHYRFVALSSEEELEQFRRGDIARGGIYENFTKWDTGDHEILAEVRGSFTEKMREGQQPSSATGVDARVYYESRPGTEVTINSVLVYSGSEPLTISYEGPDGPLGGGGNADLFPTIAATGPISVVGGATVWKSKWRIRVQQSIPYTLNRERYGVVEDEVNKSVQDVKLAFVGAGSMVQGIGAIVINLKYGILTENFDVSNRPSGDPSHGSSTTRKRLRGYGVSFGGSLTLPISNGTVNKNGTQIEQHDQRAENGFLSAAVDEVLYGVDRTDGENGEVGFIGVDTTFGLSLPENVLGKLVKNAGGAQAVFTINTIDNIYSMQFGVSLQVIECEGILSFKEVKVKNSDVLLPDTLFFAIDDGLRIPLSPPTLYITGLGGGVSDLADTIGGDYVTELPPLTISLQMRLRMIEKLVGDLKASVSASQLSASGNFTLDNASKVVQIQGGLSMRWVSPVYINVYGQVHILDDLIAGGASITIRADSFSGYIYAAIKVPHSIPLIGGKEIARVEAGVSNEFVGANIKILGIKFGVIYYWGGDFSFGSSINLGDMDSGTGGNTGVHNAMLLRSYEEPGIAAIRSSVLVDGEAVDYTAIYGTNVQPLAVTPVEAAVPMFRSRSNELPSVKAVEVSEISGDALLLELPFTGDILPTADQVTLTGPGGAVPLTLADDDGNGNFLVQERRSDDGHTVLDKTIYITVTDPGLLKRGRWTAALSGGGELTDFRVSGVASLPELTGVTAALYEGDTPSLAVGYTLDGESGSYGTLDLYLTQDPDVLEKLRSETVGTDALGLSLGSIELSALASGTQTVELPDTLPSGDHYMVATLSLPDGGMSAQRSEKISFTNPKLPCAPESAVLSYAGNGALALTVTDPSEPDYDSYLVELLDETGSPIPGASGIYGKDSAIRLDPVESVTGTKRELEALAEDTSPRRLLDAGKAYTATVQALRQTEDGSLYFSDTVLQSNSFILPEAERPVLLKLDSTLHSGLNGSNTLEATLTFDRPVALDLLLDGQDQIADKSIFQTTWTLSQTLPDGDHTLNFIAYSERYDTLTAAQTDGGPLSFTVDTAAPVLEAGGATEDSLESTSGEKVSTGVGGQVVVARDGQFTFLGRTERGVTLTANGKAVDAAIGADGLFTFTGALDNFLPGVAFNGTINLRAVDAAGNAATLPIYVMRGELADLTGLSLTADREMTGTDEKALTLTVGQQAALTAQLLYENGDPLAVNPGAVEWKVLSNLGLISLDGGVVTARSVGEVLVKASFVIGATGKDGAVQTLALEDVVRIVIAPAKFDAEAEVDTGYVPGVSLAKGYTRFEIIPEAEKPFGQLSLTDPRDPDIIIPMLYDGERKRYVCVVDGEYTAQTLLEYLKINDQRVSVLVRGDADGDGVVDETDARIIMEHYLSGGKPADANAFLSLDWNGDWQLSALDAQRNLLYRYTITQTGGEEE